MNTKATPSNYLETRESFLRALARYKNQEEELRILLNASGTGADLETKMLEARGEGLHHEAITKLATLGGALDCASDALDLATQIQRRRVAEQQATLNASFRRLEC